MVHRLLGGLAHLVHDVLGSGQVRVAHAHVHDVHALVAHLHLELVDHREHVGRQSFHAGKLFHGGLDRKSVV